MITEVYLVRHAHSDFVEGHEETRPLSERGRMDVVAVTNALVNEGVQIVCSSPYMRAIQTVEGLAKEIGVAVEIDDGFRERRFAEPCYLVKDRYKAMEMGFIEQDFSFPGGASHRDSKIRVVRAMNCALRKHEGKRVVIGTHGGVMTILMGHYDAQFGVHFLRSLQKPDIYKLVFDGRQYISVERLEL